VSLKLSDPVTKLPYIGEKYAKRLKRLEIGNIRDLLYHFPFRYQDYSQIKKIGYLAEGDEVTISGEVVKTEVVRTKHGKLLTKAAIADETGAIEATWFNQPYLKRTLKEGAQLWLAGQVGKFGGHLGFVSPAFELTQGGVAPTHTGRLTPVYPETSQISSKWLRSRVKSALEKISIDNPQLEFLPSEILKSRKLVSWGKALSDIHFPESKIAAQRSRKRFAFEELFLFNLRSIEMKRKWKNRKLSKIIDVQKNRAKIEEFIRNLPFILTKAQKRSVREVLGDLGKETPMNRLLEGDVGSGKTVVAAVAAYSCFLNGARTVLMAPTEILANQHFKTLKGLLQPYGIRCILHTGSRRPRLPSYPATQLPDLWIGTHALFHRKKGFKNVGLIIIDEQQNSSKRREVPHIYSPLPPLRSPEAWL
jgi:ATP-dependent DNA helicase RecG